MTNNLKNMDISWQPITSWASNFESHKLVKTRNHQLQFMPTNIMKMFFALLVIMPLIAFGMFSYGWFIGSAPFYSVIIGMLAGFAFAVAAKAIANIAFTPKVFDFNKQHYYAIEKSILGNVTETKYTLSEIVALQLLTKEIQDSDSNNYNAYELNLVLKDGLRQNIICHGNFQSLKEDCDTLGLHLGVPILVQDTTY